MAGARETAIEIAVGLAIAAAILVLLDLATYVRIRNITLVLGPRQLGILLYVATGVVATAGFWYRRVHVIGPLTAALILAWPLASAFGVPAPPTWIPLLWRSPPLDIGGIVVGVLAVAAFRAARG